MLRGNGFVGDRGSFRACAVAKSVYAAVVNHGEIEEGMATKQISALCEDGPV